MVTSATIVEELKADHGIMSMVVPCPCRCAANNSTGRPREKCAYCLGTGNLQYGIDEAVFFS